MQLRDLEVLDLRAEMESERRQLLQLLADLSSGQWNTPTAADGWTVKAVVLHLLDDDLGWLSRGRDRDMSGNLDMSSYRSFVKALAAKNQRWVDGAAGLSPRVVQDLLKWSGEQMDDYYASIDLSASGGVAWAGDDVPEWFDIAQDFTERWVHQMQIREALHRVEGYDEQYLPLVLSTFVWALPHQYKETAAASVHVNCDYGLRDSWHLTSDGAGNWTLESGLADDPAGALRTDPDTAWRIFTGAQYDAGRLELSGDPRLTRGLLDIRGIIV